MKHVLIRKAGVGIWLLLFAGGVCFMKHIPTNAFVTDIGDTLLSQSIVCMNTVGQTSEETIADVLGNPLYLDTKENTIDTNQTKILAENQQQVQSENSLPTEQITAGDVYEQEKNDKKVQTQPVAATVKQKNVYVEKLKNTLDVDYLWSKFYIVDATTSVSKKIFDVKKLLQMNLDLKKKSEKKQILIYHTHGASEAFADSRSGHIEDSVVGIGEELTKELEKKGYGVYHEKKQFDWINGAIERSQAYNVALERVQQILAQNKDIEVVIDLHRDSVGKGKHTYSVINGKKTAIAMFFNGMSRTRAGEIAYLYNPNLQGNLAFSLQLKCCAMEYYDGFTKPIYLKGYRYNLHLKKRSLLIELGNENNTVAEAKNAAAPLADILDKVLSKQN